MRFLEPGHHRPVALFRDIHPVAGFALLPDIFKSVMPVEQAQHGNQRHGRKKDRLAEAQRIAQPQHPLGPWCSAGTASTGLSFNRSDAISKILHPPPCSACRPKNGAQDIPMSDTIASV